MIKIEIGSGSLLNEYLIRWNHNGSHLQQMCCYFYNPTHIPITAATLMHSPHRSVWHVLCCLFLFYWRSILAINWCSVSCKIILFMSKSERNKLNHIKWLKQIACLFILYNNMIKCNCECLGFESTFKIKLSRIYFHNILWCSFVLNFYVGHA